MIGTTISHYKILEKIGEGGMGEVYLAEDTELDRKVALKFLPLHYATNPEIKTRFKREAKAAAALDHPNICTVHEIDEAGGQTFIVMAFIEGQSLKNKIETGSLGLDEALDIAIQVADGLQEAHEKGIFHRDIKSANIMLTSKGQAKIVDFGLAKLTGHTKLTQSDTTLGTIAYMSPEQMQGETVDHRTDLWSLGVVLYEMVTARLPFEEDYEAAIIYSILNDFPKLPSEIREELPVELEKIILKCLRKEPKDRYSSAHTVLTDLKKLQKALKAEKHEAIAYRKEKPETKKETERRQATVMFAEISGYNEMLGSMDAEEVATIMNSCFDMFGAIVGMYGGKIDKIMGGSFTAFFGVPAAIEDAPKEAINTAIEMRNKLYQFNQEKNLKIHLDIHIGIDTGMVLAGAMGTDGKKQFTAMGDTVNLASQLKDLSAKGHISVGPSTYRYTKNEFEYKQLKPITLKGKKKPVPMFELLSTKEKIHRAGLDAERMIYSEMVGRDKELNMLELHVLKVISGEGSIVNVIADAGIGKSRLIAELKTKEAIKRVTLLEGRALSFGKNLSYHPIIDILKNWANIKEEDSEKESFSKLEKAISNIYPEGFVEVFPFIATLMGMKLAGKHAERVTGIKGEAMEKLILKNIRELIIKGADLRPIVYIIEDLHWADMSSIELLESLFRLAENHNILFINIFRPNYEETSERILETIKERCGNYHSELYLEPLDDHQCEVLIQNLIKASGLPTDIRATIASRAEGNPFFIEEVVRSFIDEGALLLQNGSFKVTERIDTVEIPETIQDVLMVRIDRLDEQTKSLLKNASVIGRYFFHKILAAVAKAMEDMDERLEYLQGVQLILESKRVKELEYLFKHALAQEVTYESILLKKRKELHLQVANAIESCFSERLHEFYGMLALHYSKGENLEKAEEYLIKAGEEALKAAASSEALTYYQEALKLYLKQAGDTADPEKIAMLEKNIALALHNKGYFADAVGHFDKALECLGENISRNKIINVFKFLINLLSMLKGLYWPSKKAKKVPSDKDIEFLDLAYKRGEALSSVDTKRMFMDTIGFFRFFFKLDMKRIESAGVVYSGGSILFSFTGISFSLSQKILDASSKMINKNDVRSIFKHEICQTIHNYFVGNWERGYKIDENLMNLNLGLGELLWVIMKFNYSFLIAIASGDFEYAAMLLNKLSNLSVRYDYDYGRLYENKLKFIYLLNKGKLYDISKVADKSIAFANKRGFRSLNLSMLGMKAKSQLLLKDIIGAQESLNEAKCILLESSLIAPGLSMEFFISRFLLDVYLLEEIFLTDPLKKDKSRIKEIKRRAYKSGKDAIKISHKAAVKMPEALRLMGTLYWLQNKQKQALKYWDKSIKSAEHLGARPELARTYMEVGKRLLEKKSKFQQFNGLQAEAFLDKARVLFNDMELEWDLEELAKIKNQVE